MHTPTKHYLHYFPLLPFFRQRGIVSKPKITTSASPLNTPYILLSQPTNNEGGILLLEEERGGFLIFPVPSVAINAVRALLIGV